MTELVGRVAFIVVAGLVVFLALPGLNIPHAGRPASRRWLILAVGASVVLGTFPTYTAIGLVAAPLTVGLLVFAGALVASDPKRLRVTCLSSAGAAMLASFARAMLVWGVLRPWLIEQVGAFMKLPPVL